ncbi:MAG: hypothetical protein LAN71_07720 [Acidobacteriia bacterium]|nr:hypothetical protein [Terriglobia bacterium]
MTALLSWMDKGFDFLFRLLRVLPPFAVLAVFSAATAVLALVVVRWTSDQQAIRRVKDRIGAHVLEVRLFPDQLRVVLRAYLSLFGHTLLYLRYSLRPLLFMTLPLLLLFVQLEGYFGRAAAPVDRDFLLRVILRQADALPEVSLRLPPGLVQQAPPVRIAAEREVDWRLRAEQPGVSEILLRAGDSEATKRIVAGDEFTRITPVRESGGLWARMLNPGEASLPAGGAVERMEIEYPARVFHLWGWEVDWLVPYLALTLLAALLLKGVFGTEL